LPVWCHLLCQIMFNILDYRFQRLQLGLFLSYWLQPISSILQFTIQLAVLEWSLFDEILQVRHLHELWRLIMNDGFSILQHDFLLQDLLSKQSHFILVIWDSDLEFLDILLLPSENLLQLSLPGTIGITEFLFILDTLSECGDFPSHLPFLLLGNFDQWVDLMFSLHVFLIDS
jgi:hypothetical protein